MRHLVLTVKNTPGRNEPVGRSPPTGPCLNRDRCRRRYRLSILSVGDVVYSRHAPIPRGEFKYLHFHTHRYQVLIKAITHYRIIVTANLTKLSHTLKYNWYLCCGIGMYFSRVQTEH